MNIIKVFFNDDEKMFFKFCEKDLMIDFEELRRQKHLIVTCHRSPSAVLGVLSLISVLKIESINFSIKFSEQDFEIILKSDKNSSFGLFISPLARTKKSDFQILNEEVFCVCKKRIPSTYQIYYFLKRNNKLNKESLWPILVHFAYKAFHIKKICDPCILFKNELIEEGNKNNISYEIGHIPFFDRMPLIDTLRADIDFCLMTRLFYKYDYNRISLKLAEKGISLREAKENYINLNSKSQNLLKKSLPRVERFVIKKDFSSLSAVDYFFWIVYILKNKEGFSSINEFSAEKGFAILQEISKICKENFFEVKKVRNWRILVTEIEEEMFFYELIFEAFDKIFSKSSKQFALVIEKGEKHLLITRKDHKYVEIDEFKDFLKKLSETDR